MNHDQFTIEGLKGVGKVGLSFQPDSRVRVLFGSNGVGKTKTLEALLIFYLTQNQSFNAQINLLRKEGLIFEKIKVRDAVAINISDLNIVNDFYSLRNIQPLSDSSVNTHIVVTIGAQNRSTIDNSTSGVSSIGTLNDRQQAYFSSLGNAISNSSLRTFGSPIPLQHWFVSRAQSVNPYQKLTDNGKVEIDTVLEVLNKIDSRIDPKFMEIDGSLQVRLKIAGKECELTSLSSGFASLVKLIQSVVSAFAAYSNDHNLRQAKATVFIDEIESHLHAEWQAKIVPLLKELFPNTIFYIATHSPIVLSQLKQGEAYLLKRESDGVVRSHLINNPNKRLIADVLSETLGIDLNQLKIQNAEPETQAKARKLLLELLEEEHAA